MTRRIIDLSRPLNTRTEIYREDEYSDPPLVVEDWCGIETQGYWVSRLQLGTQTGTHIDAPAHLVTDGALLDAVDLNDLIGPYFLVRIEAIADEAGRHEVLKDFAGERILLLVGEAEQVRLPIEAITDLLNLGCPIWATATGIEITGHLALHFHYLLAGEGVFLIEELDHKAAQAVKPGGRMAALPLRLENVSGSPCRVVVIQGDADELPGKS